MSLGKFPVMLHSKILMDLCSRFLISDFFDGNFSDVSFELLADSVLQGERKFIMQS